MNNGDRVLIINDGCNYSTPPVSWISELGATRQERGYAGKGRWNGIEGTVVNIMQWNEKNIALVDVGERELIIGAKGLKVIQKEEKNMFKVGDEVTVVANSENNGVLTGSTGSVCRLNADGLIGVVFPFSFDGGHSCDGTCPLGNGWYFCDIDLKPTFKYKPGDIVRVTRKNLFTTGKIGEVTGVWPKSNNVTVCFDTGLSTNYLSDALELVTKAKKPGVRYKLVSPETNMHNILSYHQLSDVPKDELEVAVKALGYYTPIDLDAIHKIAERCPAFITLLKKYLIIKDIDLVKCGDTFMLIDSMGHKIYAILTATGSNCYQLTELRSGKALREEVHTDDLDYDFVSKELVGECTGIAPVLKSEVIKVC